MNKQNYTIPDIVAEWLKENRYDGLYYYDHKCDCFIDDLMPCEEIHYCKPGYLFHDKDSITRWRSISPEKDKK